MDHLLLCSRCPGPQLPAGPRNIRDDFQRRPPYGSHAASTPLSTPPLVASALAAVDMKDLAGHEASGFEVEDGVHDIADFAHPLHGVEPGQELVGLCGMHRRLDS